jgi:hypothetical protein
MRKTDLAYMAGFFDGEGSISISLQQGKYLRIEVAVSQNTADVLWMYVRQFRGNVYQSTRCYQWKCYGEGAVAFLKSLIPFMIVKRLDAEETIDAWEHRDDPIYVTELIQRKRMRHARLSEHHDAEQTARNARK